MPRSIAHAPLLHTALLLGLVAGCASEKPASEDPEPTPTVVPPCPDVVSGLPAAGQTEVHRYGPLHWTFSEATDPFIDVVDSSGAAVPGSVAMTGLTATWTPDVPLAGEADYQAQLSWCDTPRTLSLDFTTAAAPPVVVPPPDGVADPVYVLDITSGNVVQPPGVGALIQQLLTLELLVGVLDEDATSLQLHGALAIEGSTPPAQDLCLESVALPVADFTSAPVFEVGPQDLTLDVAGVPVVVQDLYLSGQFSPTGDAIEDAVMAGLVDTVALDPLIAPGSAPGATCDLLAAFGVSCQSCGAGLPTCIDLEIVDLVAPELPGAVLEVRTPTDIANDPQCP